MRAGAVVGLARTCSAGHNQSLILFWVACHYYCRATVDAVITRCRSQIVVPKVSSLLSVPAYGRKTLIHKWFAVWELFFVTALFMHDHVSVNGWSPSVCSYRAQSEHSTIGWEIALSIETFRQLLSTLLQNHPRTWWNWAVEVQPTLMVVSAG